jgi:hypothetical protein
MESMESHKTGISPFRHPWKSLRGFPHYHGYGYGYGMTIMYLKAGKARRNPAIRATLTARGL